MSKHIRGIFVLGLLAILAPACGSGGGGGSSPGGTGASFPVLPTLQTVPVVGTAGNLALDATGANVTIDVLGMSDAAAQALIQSEINNVAITPTRKIIITSSGGARTIVLTSPLNLPSNQAVPKTLILDGMGNITLSGGMATGILQIDDKAQLTVQRMKFLDARTAQNGAAVNSLARVRLATFINCNFENCQTREGGPDRGGGAIRIWGGQHTQISNCTFFQCAGSNGGAVNSLGTQLTILNSVFTQNAAFGTGGGNDATPPGRGGIGGAVYVDNVSNPDALAHQLQITGCIFNANIANDHGGAVFGFTTDSTGSVTTINNCTFAGNRVIGGAGHSGALYSQNDTLTVSNSTFSANDAAGNGGAIFRVGGGTSPSTITNCTFHANHAGNLGGALWISGSSSALLNVTVSMNSAGNFAGGLFSTMSGLTVNNSIFDSNTASGNPPAGAQVNKPGGGFTGFTGVGNLQSPNPGAGANTPVTVANTVGGTPNLGNLVNNGGPTFTRQPQGGSTAINLAGVAGAPANDQRGNGRNGAADAGSCEGP